MNPEAGLMTNKYTFGQSKEKLLPIVELRHHYIGITDFKGSMSIATDAGEKLVILGEKPCAEVVAI